MQDKQSTAGSSTKTQGVRGFWGVRYQVKDVQRSIVFYTQTLGFNLDQQNLPAFGQVSIGLIIERFFFSLDITNYSSIEVRIKNCYDGFCC
jgi:hypothetical protein